LEHLRIALFYWIKELKSLEDLDLLHTVQLTQF
jgi:hypothetical protein